MKHKKRILIIVIATILVSCSGSDTYRGKWKATDNSGQQLDINFKEKTFSITKDQDSTVFGYYQNSVKVENSIKTYGIQLTKGGVYQVYFPIPSNYSKGYLLDGHGNIVYTISRNAYLRKEQINQLK